MGLRPTRESENPNVSPAYGHAVVCPHIVRPA
jgi:hypothetical protein